MSEKKSTEWIKKIKYDVYHTYTWGFAVYVWG